MEDKEARMPFSWKEDTVDQEETPLRQKRKYTHKKIEFVGWGSKPLIEFLMYLDRDVSKQISQHDVSDIINEYVREKNLIHPLKKKKVVCDNVLHSLFGKKMINRIKIHDLLEPHYAENQDSSDDDLLYCSDENENNGQEISEKKSEVRKKVREFPKSSFAAVKPENIKLIYVKRSLVQDLSKDPESFEIKIVGSFVRIKSDPNDYLQKNSHLLVQVTGVKNGTGCSDKNAKILLQVSYAIGDIQICKLSDDNFSEEECEDLRQRVKDGLLKRMTVGELEEKAQILHEDITKHWLVRELALLQSLIDRANEKGWRREMFEHMERRDLLRTPSKQAELLQEVPEVIPDELETEAIPQESSNNESEDLPKRKTQVSNNAYRSNLVDAPVPSTSAVVWSATVASQTSVETNFTASTEVAAVPPDIPHIREDCSIPSPKSIPHMENPGEERAQNRTVTKENSDIQNYIHENQRQKQEENGHLQLNRNIPPVIIVLSDEDEDEGFLSVHNIPAQGKGPLGVGDEPNDVNDWHYLDPRGNIQGPFSIIQLKEWFNAEYFPMAFKVWKNGQSQEQAVFLIDVLRQMFPCLYR